MSRRYAGRPEVFAWQLDNELENNHCTCPACRSELLQDPEILLLEAPHKVQHKGVGIQILSVLRQADGRVVIVGGYIQLCKFLVGIRPCAVRRRSSIRRIRSLH